MEYGILLALFLTMNPLPHGTSGFLSFPRLHVLCFKEAIDTGPQYERILQTCTFWKLK
jgi:hypothetical protein